VTIWNNKPMVLTVFKAFYWLRVTSMGLAAMIFSMWLDAYPMGLTAFFLVCHWMQIL
jgi:hypothetical protein